MADVFLSYSQEDERAARVVVERLADAGLSVFWDRGIGPGQHWRDVLEREIGRARAVVVLWSRSSVQSGWVKEEAQHGADRDCLIPILIDAVTPPLGFARYQALRLDWGTSSSAGTVCAAVVEAVLALPGVGGTSRIAAGTDPPFTVSAESSPQRVVLAAVANSMRTSLDALKGGLPLSEATIIQALEVLESNGCVQRHVVRSKGTRFSATARGRSLLHSK